MTTFSSETVSTGSEIVWSREDVSGDATFAFTNLYQSGAPQEAVKVTADAAFGALATWLSEQQRLVERAFEARAAARCRSAVPTCGPQNRRLVHHLRAAQACRSTPRVSAPRWSATR